jgi:26S proteasome regulatory subunit N10
MAGKRVEVHVTLTNDVSRILNSIKAIQLAGDSDFVTALNIATLTLKHRQNKNQKQRIILFIGSPIKHSVEEMVQTAKKLKKYNIAVDIISFGNVDENREHIQQFFNNINNANNSSIQEVPVGYNIMDVLFSSPIFNEASEYGNMPVENIPSSSVPQNQGGMSGGMSQFERDMHLAIQQSLEEERKKKEVVKTEKTEMKVDDIEVSPEDEDDLEAAKRLSMEEHMKVLQKEKEQEGNLYLYR